MPVPLSDYYEALRTLLGDEGDADVGYDWTEDKLLGGLRTVISLNYVGCLSLADTPGRDHLAEAPKHPDTIAYLITKAAHLMTGGEKAESFKTRALSFGSQPTALRDRLHYIEYLLEEIESRGNVCGPAGDAQPGLFATSEDFVTCARMLCDV